MRFPLGFKRPLVIHHHFSGVHATRGYCKVQIQSTAQAREHEPASLMRGKPGLGRAKACHGVAAEVVQGQ
jgi:Holliday junction resolvasome RuvABC ATP-dependent DNA helicase subunit